MDQAEAEAAWQRVVWADVAVRNATRELALAGRAGLGAEYDKAAQVYLNAYANRRAACADYEALTPAP